MFRVGTSRLFVAAVLLFLFVTSSALGAAGRHNAARGASHHGKHKGKPATHRRHKRGAFVGAERGSRAEVASAAVLLGDSSVESQNDSLPAGEGEAFRLGGTLTGLADVAHIYISAHSAAKTVVVGIYNNSGGRPGLLLSAGSAPATAPGTWTPVAITPIQLVAGRVYWLAILGEGGTLRGIPMIEKSGLDRFHGADDHDLALGGFGADGEGHLALAGEQGRRQRQEERR